VYLLATVPVGFGKKVKQSGDELHPNCQFVRVTEIFDPASDIPP
jgi:hypothetical protein